MVIYSLSREHAAQSGNTPCQSITGPPTHYIHTLIHTQGQFRAASTPNGTFVASGAVYEDLDNYVPKWFCENLLLSVSYLCIRSVDQVQNYQIGCQPSNWVKV